MAHAHHRNAWLRQHFEVAANLGDSWRIVNFFQPPGEQASSGQSSVTPAAAARALSSRASSADFPVATDCAETALIPVLSSSVNDAWKPTSRRRNVRSIPCLRGTRTGSQRQGEPLENMSCGRRLASFYAAIFSIT